MVGSGSRFTGVESLCDAIVLTQLLACCSLVFVADSRLPPLGTLRRVARPLAAFLFVDSVVVFAAVCSHDSDSFS